MVIRQKCGNDDDLQYGGMKIKHEAATGGGGVRWENKFKEWCVYAGILSNVQYDLKGMGYFCMEVNVFKFEGEDETAVFTTKAFRAELLWCFLSLTTLFTVS